MADNNQSKMNNLTHLLSQLSLIKKEYDMVRDRQEKFNIFTVLHKPHDERRLHSRFLAALLNPVGSHGFGNDFLKLFFTLNSVKVNIEDFQNAVVYPEEWNKIENNNIDILIIDRITKHAVIIENKIYAGDSNGSDGGQLERYFMHIRDNEHIPSENIRVFYLTLDGHAPSKESFGKFETLLNINGNLLSYLNDILSWLNECLKLTAEKPFIRESIIQYQKLLKQLTMNETEIEERKKIKDLIAETSQNMEATKYLIDNFNHVKWHTIADFWDELSKAIDVNKGIYKVTENINSGAIDAIAHSSLNKTEEEDGIYFDFMNGNRGLIYHSPNDALWFGFQIDRIKDEKLKQKLEKLVIENKIIKGGVNYYLYFNKIGGAISLNMAKDYGIFLKNFSNQNTFDLIDPNKRANTIKEIVDQVDKFIKENFN